MRPWNPLLQIQYWSDGAALGGASNSLQRSAVSLALLILSLLVLLLQLLLLLLLQLLLLKLLFVFVVKEFIVVFRQQQLGHNHLP